MAHVLLLNASWEPLRVLPLKRAIVLILANKADVVEQRDGLIRSVSVQLPEPAIIRLRYYVKVPYRARVALNRKNVSARDGGRCQYCGKSGDTIDHVVPRSKGGPHAWTNVVLACKACNGKKAHKLLAELGWTLEKKPTAPDRARVVFVGIAELDQAWEPYLLTA